MTQGHRYMTPSGSEGIEIAAEGDRVKLMLIDKVWPFPLAPRWFRRDDLKPMPMAYFHGEVPSGD